MTLMEHEDILQYALCLGLGAWRLSSRALPRPASPDYLVPEVDEAVLRAVSRAAKPDDANYLRSRPVDVRELVRYLHSSRRELLHLHLRQIKLSFTESSRIVRQFAADTDAPDLAMLALRRSTEFHALWWALRLSLALPIVRPTWRLVERLASASHIRAARSSSEENPAASS